MRLQTSAFGNDKLSLSWWDLIQLFFGRTLKVSALVITARPKTDGAKP